MSLPILNKNRETEYRLRRPLSSLHITSPHVTCAFTNADHKLLGPDRIMNHLSGHLNTDVLIVCVVCSRGTTRAHVFKDVSKVSQQKQPTSVLFRSYLNCESKLSAGQWREDTKTGDSEMERDDRTFLMCVCPEPALVTVMQRRDIAKKCT